MVLIHSHYVYKHDQGLKTETEKCKSVNFAQKDQNWHKNDPCFEFLSPQNNIFQSNATT